VRVVLEISAGELFDRIGILELKRSRLPAHRVLAIERQLAAARAERDRQFVPSVALSALADALAQVNRELWEIEDELRSCERLADFGDDFIALARSVYSINDRRAALKRRIDELVGSELSEQKSYPLPELDTCASARS
jgi:hypothetical protein